MLKIFKKKKADDHNFHYPINGTLKKITEVEDPIFAQEIMGSGFAIEPTEDALHAPFSGIIVSLFPTNHAIGLRRADGVEVLIHIGIDTVNLQGEGFEPLVNEGDKVEIGQKIIAFNLEELDEKVPSTDVVIIFIKSSYPIDLNKLTYGQEITTTDEVPVLE